MKDILLIYVIVQLLSNAYGLGVIWSVQSSIEEKLRDKGYVLKNRDSLYKFNDKLGKIAKAFIPGYYAIKAISLIQAKNPVANAVENEIKSGNYVTPEEQIDIYSTENNELMVKVISDPQIVFEKPDRYTARKNDISLYDTYEVPIDYEEHEDTLDRKLEITPFVGEAKIMPEIIKEPVNSSDIAKAISELDSRELEELSDKVLTLAKMKRNRSLRLKDVA